jgi:rhamnosyl/mannosyltransferase
VPPADPEALAAALRRLLDDPPAARRAAGEQFGYVRPRFDLSRMADETMRLYRRILAGEPGHTGS